MIKSNNKIGKKEKNMYINYGKCYKMAKRVKHAKNQENFTQNILTQEWIVRYNNGEKIKERTVKKWNSKDLQQY